MKKKFGFTIQKSNTDIGISEDEEKVSYSRVKNANNKV